MSNALKKALIVTASVAAVLAVCLWAGEPRSRALLAAVARCTRWLCDQSLSDVKVETPVMCPRMVRACREAKEVPWPQWWQEIGTRTREPAASRASARAGR